MKKIIFFVVPVFIIFYWQRAITPESARQPSIPMDVNAVGENKSIVLTWIDSDWSNTDGYVLYYGTESGKYTDSLIVRDSLLVRVSGLHDDTRYFFKVRSFNKVGLSPISQEVSAQTYYVFEDFNQHNGTLDPNKWQPEIGYLTPVSNKQVDAAEIEQYLGRIKKSYGQYKLANPTDDVIIECQFKIGYPNVGGAGVMLRAEKVHAKRYYSGYTAYIFWTGEQWELRLEESNRDICAMQPPKPLELAPLKPNSWVKVSLEKQGNLLTARVFDLADYSLLGMVQHKEKKRSKRPQRDDGYCGFYTCQYGGNTIIADNFGLKRSN
ncbi:fibronectin type III domain-containing protein [candidate division KSB1 bacterium]|nr:fibronectin type III domain-containing protein [candidate division KSB1 bacterium]